MVMTRPARHADHAGWLAWPDLLIIGALVLTCLLLAPKLIVTARYDAAILRFPFQVDDTEGVLIAEAELIAQGTDPYAYQPSPAHYFYAGPYTPVYTLLNSGAVAALGPTFKFGRAVQLLATIAVAGWLAWAVRHAANDRRSWIVGGWAGILFLSVHLVTIWSVRVRPDMTALAFNALGVIVLRAWLGADDREQWSGNVWPRGATLARLAVGTACFALGWWTKQTFIALPLACIVATTVRQPKIGVVIAALYAAMIALPFGVLTLLTGGGFAQKTVGYQGSWQWQAFRRLAQPFVERYAALIAVAALFALVLVVCRRRLTYAVCWFASSGVVALGAGTSGGNHNHFVEFVAATALLVGQCVAALVTTGARERRMAWAMPVLGALIMLGITASAITEHEGRTGWLAREYHTPTASERAGLMAVASFIANSPGPVYSNNVGILVVTGQPVRVTDPFTMAAEVRLGRWDDALLVADVAAGKYPVIALSYNDVATLNPDLPPTDATPGLIRAIQTRYRLIERNVLRLYVPK
ncbi:MAG: hypothetical protein M3008_03925 [Chloroflexota bacterium]|nr:hypothetical protein [Chloroflexota bacterium]